MTDFSSYSDGMNKSLPLGSESISGGDDRIREFKEDLAYRLTQDHIFDYSGDTCDGTNTGLHRRVVFAAALGAAPGLGMGALYTVTDTYDELNFENSNGDTLQVTKDGKIYLGANVDYTEEVQLTNTGNSLYGDLVVCTALGRLMLPTDTTDTTEGNITYDTTNDVVKFRNASAWLTLVSTGTQAIDQACHGSGTGNGQSADIGFAPDFIIAWNESNNEIWMWSSLDASANKQFSEGNRTTDNLHITVSGVSNQTVTLDNFTTSTTCHFIAIKFSASEVTLSA